MDTLNPGCRDAEFAETSYKNSELVRRILESAVPSKEENLILVKKSKSGDKDSINELIIRNGKLIFYVLRKYSYPDDMTDDLIQEGMIGIQKAVEEFDFSFNSAFSTYALFWIQKYISAYIFQNLYAVKYSRSVLSRMHKIKVMDAKREKDGLPALTDAECAAIFNISIEDASAARAGVQTAFSLDMPFSDDSDTVFGDTLVLDDYEVGHNLIEESARESFLNLLKNTLSERELDVIQMHYGISAYNHTYTFNQIADKYHVSRARAEQIHRRAMEKLRSTKSLRMMKACGIVD